MAGLLADWLAGCVGYQVLPQLSFLSFSTFSDKFNLLACFKQKLSFYSLALLGQSERERESPATNMDSDKDTLVYRSLVPFIQVFAAHRMFPFELVSDLIQSSIRNYFHL